MSSTVNNVESNDHINSDHIDSPIKDNRYNTLSAKIIEIIESSNSLPWSRPWTIDYSRGSISGTESNLSTGKFYSGVNTIILGWIRQVTPSYRPYWIGYNQCKSLIKEGNCSVNKGSKGYPIFYPKLYKDIDTNGNEYMKLSGFGVSYVFNIAQTNYNLDLLDVKPVDTTEEVKTPSTIIECEDVINRYKNHPIISEVGNEAVYYPSLDCIHMPNRTQFKSLSCYYKTLYHELTHSTGHQSRLNRPLKGHSDKLSYSNEELIAEFGSCFLSSITKINCEDDDIRNSAGYIASWKKYIKADPMCLPKAAGAAEKAVKFMLNGINEVS
jgi:antirestriction protein ArdC